MNIGSKYSRPYIYINSTNHQQVFNCQVEGQNIPEGSDLKFSDTVGSGYATSTITCITFENCTITKIPQGCRKYFPNLKFLIINNSKLKFVCQSDLSEYKYLERISFNSNEIEYLPFDLFEGFKNLQEISFFRNNLKVIEPNLLDGLENLKFVDFRENTNYDVCYWNNFNNLPAEFLLEARNYLTEKYCSRLKFAKNLKKSKELLEKAFQESNEENERLIQLNNELINSEEILKAQIENLTIQNEKGICADLKKLAEDENFKDFRIIIDDRVFRVHKFVLAARSPTFAEMLRNNPEAENLNLVDIPVGIFEHVYKFLYTDELPLENEVNFAHLFAAANHLKIKGLKNFAAAKMHEEINAENAFEALKLGNQTGNVVMRQKAFEEIKKNHPNFELKDEWAEDDQKLEKIIKILKAKEKAIKKADEKLEELLKENDEAGGEAAGVSGN